MTETCTSAHAQYSTAPCQAGTLPFTGSGILLTVLVVACIAFAVGALLVFGPRKWRA